MQTRGSQTDEAAVQDDATDERSAAVSGIEPLPDEVSSPRAKLVLFYLRVAGGADVGDLVGTLGMQRLTLYPVLESLASAGFVERRGSRYAPAA